MKLRMPSVVIFVLLANILWAENPPNKSVEIRAETVKKEAVEQFRFSLAGESKNLFIIRCNYTLVLKYKNSTTKTLKGSREQWDRFNPLIIAVSPGSLKDLESYGIAADYDQIIRSDGQTVAKVSGYKIYSTFVVNSKEQTP